ncbi:unnamed protein product [Bemisia tabaci]|uniref:receptor protein serine/threonine kinase n=1 Tax=Bemisia tabaci TaxID=7038 RepID=A0A9P0F5H5_BEMTA|nr:unnamed protein product [Bemisia tabaci]
MSFLPKNLLHFVITLYSVFLSLVSCEESILCYCEPPDYCPDGTGTCVLSPGSQCFSSIEEDADGEEPFRTYGCLPPEESSDMQCKGNLSPHVVRKSIDCCNFTDLCNKNLHPALRLKPESPSITSWEDSLLLLALAASVTCGLLIFISLSVYCHKRLKRRENVKQLQYLSHPMLLPPATLSDLLEQSSGSGSGLPLFVQRTIAKQIEPLKVIGKGRHGEVWLANWRDDKVAVKIFSTTEEKSWFRETEIYQTVLMRHNNILGFVAADIKGTGSWTQMLLITEYHENGSLYDYLQSNELDVESLLSLICSIAAGIAHLHTEIFGTQGKPAIAHRDIKSKNILVKRNNECVIADFGLAVRYNSEINGLDIVRDNVRVGTKRYMPPEVLDGTIDALLDESADARVFEALKMADIYSLSLVIWELCRRCNGGKDCVKVEEYKVPYHDVVPSDPSFDDMYNVVVKDNIRPKVPEKWHESTVLDTISKIMQECWHPNPSVRPTALRVKKSLMNLRDAVERSTSDFIEQ